MLTILFYFAFSLLFFSLINDLISLILEVVAQGFNANAELLMPTGITGHEAKAEIETHPVIVESKMSEWSM